MSCRTVWLALQVCRSGIGREALGGLYAWSYQNSEYMHNPHVSVWLGQYCLAQQLAPSRSSPEQCWASLSYIICTLDTKFYQGAAFLSASHWRRIQGLGCRKLELSAALGWLVFQTIFVLQPVQLYYYLLWRTFPRKMPWRFIRFKHASFGFDRFLMGSSSITQTYLHLFYKYRVDQQQVESYRYLRFYQK